MNLFYNLIVITPTYTTELKLLPTYRLIAGIDEVGRAPLAGPVVSAAVILDPKKVGHYRSKTKWWVEVRDSKTLSAKQRARLVEFIKLNAYDFGIGLASHEEIDEINIHNATLLSMSRAIENLNARPHIILIDGQFTIPEIDILQQAVIDGDASVLSIAAASVLAKVYRDDLMEKYAKHFPYFGFERHKGYDTVFHRKKLLQYGPSSIHRMSFSTVRDIMNQRFKKAVSK